MSQIEPKFQPYAPPSHLGQSMSQGPKHSRLGIASFVIGMVMGFSAFALVMLAGFIEMSSPNGMDEESAAAVLIGLSVFGIFGFSFIGAVLGFCGIFQANTKKVFVFLGIGANVLVLLGLFGLLVIGMTMA